MPDNQQNLQEIGKELVKTSLIAVTSLALANKFGLVFLANVATNIASNFFQSGGEKLYTALTNRHASEDDANHDLQWLFGQAIKVSLTEIEASYLKKEEGKLTSFIQEDIAYFTKNLQKIIEKELPPFDAERKEEHLQNYLKGKQSAIEDLEAELGKHLQNAQNISEDFHTFFCQKLPSLVQLYFCELLKDEGKRNVRAWKAYQKMLLDGLEEGQAKILQAQILTHEQIGKLVLEIAEIKREPEKRLSDALKLTMTSIQSRLGMVVRTLQEILASNKAIEGKVDRILDIVEGKQNIPQFLTPNIFRPEVFIGRKKDLQAVYGRLWENKTEEEEDNLLLLVNGEGGIGKTTLAAKYYHQFAEKYEHLAWVFAEKSLTDALLTLALPLQMKFDQRLSNEERLPLLLQKTTKFACALFVGDRQCQRLEGFEATLQTAAKL